MIYIPRNLVAHLAASQGSDFFWLPLSRPKQRVIFSVPCVHRLEAELDRAERQIKQMQTTIDKNQSEIERLRIDLEKATDKLERAQQDVEKMTTQRDKAQEDLLR